MNWKTQRIGNSTVAATSKNQIRSTKVHALVDGGSVMLVLPQDVVEALGSEQLAGNGRQFAYADERREERPLAGVVTVRTAGRSTSVTCVVGPPASEPLIGQIVLEALDLLVDCTQQKLAPGPESPFLPLFKL